MQEKPPWLAFTAAPGEDVAQCFFDWEKGLPFAVWGFPDTVVRDKVIPILSRISRKDLEGSFCTDIAPFAKITPLTFSDTPVNRRGLFRLDMAQRSRAYTWYFMTASSGCEDPAEAWLPMQNWTATCHQVPARNYAQLSADYLWDVPQLLGSFTMTLTDGFVVTASGKRQVVRLAVSVKR